MRFKKTAVLLAVLMMAAAVFPEDVTLSLRILFECDFIDAVYIDGVSTQEMNYSGKPFNVTILTSRPAILRAVEYNGYVPFALPQYVDSNVSNYAYGKTNASSVLTAAVVPTGAEALGGFETWLGNYSGELRFALQSNPGSECVISLNITNRSLSNDFHHVSVPNRDNIAYFNDYIYRTYGNVKAWNGGEKWNFTVYTNGTGVGDGFTLTAGKPAELNITVLNETLDPVPSAFVQASEINGFQPWSALQFQESNVSNAAVARMNADANGNARFTIIPTGGLPSLDTGPLGAYSVNLSVYKENTLIYSKIVPVSNRGLSQAPGTGEAVANQANIEYYNDYIFRVYSGVKEWLWR